MCDIDLGAPLAVTPHLCFHLLGLVLSDEFVPLGVILVLDLCSELIRSPRCLLFYCFALEILVSFFYIL